MKKNYFAILLASFLISGMKGQQLLVPDDYSNIQAAINAATEGDTVLVSEGTYFENINFRGKAISVASHFILDGNRAHITNTIINGSQPSHPDSASVVTFNSGEDTTSVLNGFTITGGKGNRFYMTPLSTYWQKGGGVNIAFCGGKIINNNITGNTTTITGYQSLGGGISALPDDENEKCIIIRNNIVSNNIVTSNTYAQGGGISASAGKYTLVENNIIKNNKSICTGKWKANGGGLMLGAVQPWNTSLIVRNNQILENEILCSAAQGAGIFLTFPPFINSYKAKQPTIHIYNNIIANNYSQDLAGGVAFWDQNLLGYNWDHPSLAFYNNTVVNNKANDGVGMFNYCMKTLVFNNIYWNDISATGAREFKNDNVNYSPVIKISANTGVLINSHNAIQGGVEGEGNLFQNPKLNDAFSPMKGSPCIGSATDSVEVYGFWYKAPLLDVNGNKRPNIGDNRVDLGAFETDFLTYNSETVINVPAEQPTIQEAIDAAKAGDTVLVAKGTYFENINFNGKAITVASHFILDGDTSFISKTIIDGSKAVDPNNASVVRFDNCMDTTSVLSGFTITGGKGTRSYVINKYITDAAGISIKNAGGKVISNKITGNSINVSSDWASGAGIGAINIMPNNYNVLIRNNQIYNNQTSTSSMSFGAGIASLMLNGKLTIEKNEVYNNTSICTSTFKAFGAGIEIEKGLGHTTRVIVRNNFIHHNQLKCPASVGAGIYVVLLRDKNGEDLNSNVPVIIYNNILSQNSSQEKGGGICVWNMCKKDGLSQTVPDPIISNNTIVNNKAEEGSAIFHYDAETVLFNNILWNDLSAENCTEIYNGDINYPGGWPKNENDGIIHASYNIFQGGYEGDNNWISEPQFITDTYQLAEGSPGIGWGSESLKVDDIWYNAAETDFYNVNRKLISPDDFIDIGAFESPFAKTTGINELLIKKDWVFITPNPINSTAIISIANQKQINRIELIDLNGRVVKIINNINSNKTSFNRDGLANGLYLMRIIANEVHVSKVVVE